MTIQRSNGNGSTPQARFTAGLNIVLIGSKKMTPEEQDALMAVEAVKVTIADASNPENVLVETTAPAKEFDTGSVGYGIYERSVTFPA
jgi:hypothetical protein